MTRLTTDLPDDGTLTRSGADLHTKGKILIIACGALAREILMIRDANGWSHMDLTCLPAIYHLYPEKITDAVREAVANAVKHGNQQNPDKKVEVDFSVDGEELIIEVHDEGGGFKPEEVDDPLEPENMLKSSDPAEQRKLMRQFEKHAVSDEALMMTTLWWNRISVHRSYVKGWKTSPSHYLNQHLESVWLDK